MTYVREQKSAELAVHMRSLKKMAGWFDPLSDRLWQEVEALQALVAGLKTGYEAYERVNAELKADVEAEVFRSLLREMRSIGNHAPAELTLRIDAAMGKGERS